MKTPHVTGTAVALAATSLLALGPVAFADENAQPVPAASAAQLSTLAQTAEENTSTPTAEDQKPAEEETPEPIEVIPVPTPSDDAEPTPAPSEPAEPSPEPTEPPEETPEPIEVVPVPTPEPSEQPSESAEPEPAPEATESETATAEPTAEPTADATVEPSAEPSESENAPVPVETIAPTSSALAEEAAPEASAEAVPVQVDAEQNILLTGTVTQEQTTETGETIVVTEEVTAAGEQITTEFVVNPAEGQTTVTQTVTNPATGEKKTTERKVPATTFKAGSAASIEAAPATDRKNAAPLLLGVVGATGVSLAAAGIILYRRQATTAS